jgi:hypothetical protein
MHQGFHADTDMAMYRFSISTSTPAGAVTQKLVNRMLLSFRELELKSTLMLPLLIDRFVFSRAVSFEADRGVGALSGQGISGLPVESFPLANAE